MMRTIRMIGIDDIDIDDDGKTKRNDDEKRDDVKWRRKISMIKLKIRGLRRQ